MDISFHVTVTFVFGKKEYSLPAHSPLTIFCRYRYVNIPSILFPAKLCYIFYSKTLITSRNKEKVQYKTLFNEIAANI